MATEVIMPQLGESVTEGMVARWLKAPGDRIKRFDPLVEVITDKVNAEIPSPVAGVLREIQVYEGATVDVGRTLALIDEDVSVVVTAATSSQPRADQAESVSSAERRRTDAEPAASDGGVPEGKRTSPLVRRLAREHSVDLALIQGSGMGGRVTKDDILAYITRHAAPGSAAPGEAIQLPVPGVAFVSRPDGMSEPHADRTSAEAAHQAVGDRTITVTPMRRAIAQRLSQSTRTIPDAWLMVEVDVSGLVRLRERVKEEFEQRTGVHLTYLPIIARAVVEALAEHQVVNSTWAEDRIIIKRQVNLGIAVALDDGLIVPVIRDADRLSVTGFAQAIADLAGKARSGTLAPQDVQGGTFTLNNSGAFGSIASHPIINYPQAAILNVEAIGKRPVVISDGDGDAIAIRSMLNLCMAFDHRIMDGAQAGRFIQNVRRRLERIGPETPLF